MGEVSWHVLRQIVYERADGCCEYCQTCETNSGQTMQVDYIDPIGDDVLDNLCLSCWNCNSSKHRAMLVPDPETRGTSAAVQSSYAGLVRAFCVD
jgi:hypothetical protein